jgi:hypothetical protein
LKARGDKLEGKIAGMTNRAKRLEGKIDDLTTRAQALENRQSLFSNRIGGVEVNVNLVFTRTEEDIATSLSRVEAQQEHLRRTLSGSYLIGIAMQSSIRIYINASIPVVHMGGGSLVRIDGKYYIATVRPVADGLSAQSWKVTFVN